MRFHAIWGTGKQREGRTYYRCNTLLLEALSIPG
jgi:hypothetical protein